MGGNGVLVGSCPNAGYGRSTQHEDSEGIGTLRQQVTILRAVVLDEPERIDLKAGGQVGQVVRYDAIRRQSVAPERAVTLAVGVFREAQSLVGVRV